MNPPKISIIMAVYNGEQYLIECIESILQQSFQDFEFIIVDDASTDGTADILSSWVKKDTRIHILTNTTNKERCYSRNRAIQHAQTDFIAVMDADDYACSERLKEQYFFLQEHPEISACGTAFSSYETGEQIGISREKATAFTLFACPLAHPSVMMRKKAVLAVGGYDESFPPAEDYALWSSLVLGGYKLANIPHILLRYRTHPQSLRIRYNFIQREYTERIWLKQFFALGFVPTRRELDRHIFCLSPCPETRWQLRATTRWLKKIATANKKNKIVPQEELENIIENIKKTFPKELSLYQQPLKWFKRNIRHILKWALSFIHGDNPINFFIEIINEKRKFYRQKHSE